MKRPTEEDPTPLATLITKTLTDWVNEGLAEIDPKIAFFYGQGTTEIWKALEALQNAESLLSKIDPGSKLPPILFY